MADDKSLLEQRPDYLVCTCMGVMYHEIVKEIEAGSTTFEQLKETLMVGTGCSTCVPEVQAILREMGYDLGD